jgi:hypothetical protein
MRANRVIGCTELELAAAFTLWRSRFLADPGAFGDSDRADLATAGKSDAEYLITLLKEVIRK